MNTTADPVIQATGLRRRYGTGRHGFEAVRGIDLHVNRGELFALLGTNGAGKTSTLEVLEGLAPASGGTVRVLGHDPIKQRSRIISRIGVMLQSAGFPESLTVAETATMWHGTLTHPRSVASVLADVQLSDRASVPVKSLSGGEKRRLDLGLALMGRPELVFLDEPTTGLDPQSRQVTWQLVRSLLEEGCTVVLTTHYLAEAEELASRLAIMHHGVIHTEGTVADIVATQNARIDFQCSGTELLDLASLPALAAPINTSAEGRVQLQSSNLQVTLAALLDEAERQDLRLGRLQARSASLEQAFLAISDAERRAA
ncbi:ABC transporter ATP-binding protein [Luteococcus sp. Sow4_B9]|uniref:ABC transporter ATP-binding protein n=1 Tax=Luteococcus sp. Sow4_B9 TaxID=3438792 RepID=UPI003F97079A